MTTNRPLARSLKKIIAMLIVLSIVPVVAAYGWFSSSTPVIEFSKAGDLPSPLMAKSDHSGGGNSGGNSGGGDSGGGNSGGNSGGGGDSGGDNSGGSNTGGSNTDNSKSVENSGTDKGKSDTETGNDGAKTDNAQDKGTSGGTAAGAAGSPDTKANQGTGTPISISGSHINSRENAREITIDTQKAKDSGEKISVEGSTISFSKGPMTIDVTTAASPKEANGVITADIKSISMEHQPVTALVKDAGTVSASFKADLMSLPPSDATITAVIAEKPGPATQVAIDQAVSKNGYQLDAVAYTMDVAKTHLNDGKDIGLATVTMSVTPSWVIDHGGITGVKIARFADDGTSQLLETRYVGLDSAANMVVEGTSPGGLSIFALISVKAQEQAIAQQSQPGLVTSEPVPYYGAIRTIGLATPLVILGIILMIRRK